MGIHERRERHKTELRQLIVDTARQLFARDGFESVSMRKIADAIEYSPTAIYLHFPDKAALFFEICRQDFDAFAAAFHEIARVADPIERIRLSGLAYIEFGVKHPQHYRLMFLTPVADEMVRIAKDPEARKRRGDPAHDGYAFLEMNVRAALEEGAFRDEYADAHLICQTLWAAMHGLTALEVTHCKDPWMDWRPLADRSRVMTESILVGLCKPGRFVPQQPRRAARLPRSTGRAAR